MIRRTIFAVILFSISIVSNAYTISHDGKESIKKYEQCSLTAYWDSNGYSIGWGHHGSDVKKNMKISKAKANQLFDEDIKAIEAAANRLLKPFKYNFSQSFFDGVCDLVYNCGESGTKNSEFYRRLKACRIKNGVINKNDLNFTIAAVKTMRISAPGHVTRRYEIHKKMLN